MTTQTAEPLKRGLGVSRAAWLAAFGGLLMHLIMFGISSSSGVFLLAVSDTLHAGQSEVAWAFGLSSAVLLLASRWTGHLADRFGTRPVVALGGVLMATGLLAASRAEALWQLWLAYGVVFGLGQSCGFAPVQGAVARRFGTRRGLGVGIAVSGTGIGIIVVLPLTSHLVANDGWRTAMAILAAIALAVSMLASLLIGREISDPMLPVGQRLWHDRRFRFLALAMVAGAYGYAVPFVYLIPDARHHGMSVRQAAVVVACMGLASALGRILIPVIASRAQRLTLLRLALAMMALDIAIWPLLTSYVALICFALVFGACGAMWVSVPPALVYDYFGEIGLRRTIGTAYIAQVPGSLIAPPVTGFLFDTTGTYTDAFLLAALVLVAGCLALFGIPAPDGTRRSRRPWRQQDWSV